MTPWMELTWKLSELYFMVRRYMPKSGFSLPS